jgi:hypothetical protein
MNILIDKDKIAIEIMHELFMEIEDMSPTKAYEIAETVMDNLSVTFFKDCVNIDREFIPIITYIEHILDCTDEQRETLMGLVLRLAEYMTWGENNE